LLGFHTKNLALLTTQLGDIRRNPPRHIPLATRANF